MEIISNGSKWAGESPDTVEELLAVLETHTLHPRFVVDGGDFVRDEGEGRVSVLGNFWDVSHVFQIRGDAAEMEPIIKAIRVNQQTEAYLAAVAELEEVRA